MNRMVPGVIFFILIIVTFIMFYAVFNMPLAYTVDSLNKAYVNISDDGAGGVKDGWTAPDEIKGTYQVIVWALAGACAVGIGLMFVYLYALAHKQEYDITYIDPRQRG
jgi:hypothetical protein